MVVSQFSFKVDILNFTVKKIRGQTDLSVRLPNFLKSAKLGQNDLHSVFSKGFSFKLTVFIGQFK